MTKAEAARNGAKETLEQLTDYERSVDALGVRVKVGWLKDVVEGIAELEERISIMEEGNSGWHFIHIREATEEEKESYREQHGDDPRTDELKYIENLPDDGDEVLLWTTAGFAIDVYDDGKFDWFGEIEQEGMAWKYLPEPPEEGAQE